MRKWNKRDTIWLIAVCLLAGALSITVFCEDNLDVISIISVMAGIISIVLAIYAIIQSMIYDERSSITYEKMIDKLDNIDSKQDGLYNVIDGMKEKIDTDSGYSSETKRIIKVILDKTLDEYHKGVGHTIQNTERAVVGKKVEKDLTGTILKKGGMLLSTQMDFIDVSARFRNKNLFFTYSVRNTISGDNWPDESASNFFYSRISTYSSYRQYLKGIWIVLIIFSDTVYYYITDDETHNPIQNKLSLGEKDVLKSAEWMKVVMNDINMYIDHDAKAGLPEGTS